ncbi:hypothetical protein ACHZV7_001062 [Neisseria gonorrhoeae]|uniref:hypothetical protein n=1 Tax=Neisseria gonorrhoeae TaxID=485 RepID=UPI0017816C65|nr:hypothetical protein IBX82_01115 [Neisseria gonorrhoeae]
MKRIKCFCDKFPSGDTFRMCIILDDYDNRVDYYVGIYDYITSTLMSDIYYRSTIDEHFKIIELIENNPNEIYDDGGGQQFCLEFHHDKVIFYHNEFDGEDGYPVLSCSLHTFKTALIAWNAFLQLPKSIHSVVETVIEE